jgi:hypothetical protein
MVTENRMRSVEDRLLTIETKLDSHTERFNSIDARLNTLTLIVFGNVAATILGVVGIIATVLLTRGTPS